MIVALLAATILMADAAPAATPTPVDAKAAPAAVKKTSNDQLVCRSEPVLGSRMPVKKCRTAGDAAMEKLEAQQNLAKMQGNNNISSK
jgi:hypothetical protein